MPFSWLFAIIAGIVIISLAIYISSKIINTGDTKINAQTGKEIGILLNPLETGVESSKSVSFTLPVETRIYSKCNKDGAFGKQIIQIEQKSFNKWTETDIDVSFSNKYIFSEEYIEGKEFFVFSKPFIFPFKVADLIYLTSADKKYCFIDAPEDIKDEISSVGQKNLFAENCLDIDGYVRVCFSNDLNCDIDVDYNLKKVTKNHITVYFQEDALMYAAIFGDSEVYECQVKRLMQRVSNLALVYKDKTDIIHPVGCDSNINLVGLSTSAKVISSSSNLKSLEHVINDIKNENDMLMCRLW